MYSARYWVVVLTDVLLKSVMEYAGIEQRGWMEAAQDRGQWKQMVNGMQEPVGQVEVHAVLRRRAGV